MEVSAEDDFALNEVTLHYSVNGGAEKTVSMLSQKGAKNSEGKHVIALEDYKLSAGDIVSIYATARDARNTTKTDIYFIQAEPFERNYSQSQQEGSGERRRGSENLRTSKRHRCRNLERSQERRKGPGHAAEDAKFLGQMQEKLAAQAKSLADRVKARGLDSSPEMQSYVKNMEQAVVTMTESAKKIRRAEMDRRVSAAAAESAARITGRGHLPRHSGRVRK